MAAEWGAWAQAIIALASLVVMGIGGLLVWHLKEQRKESKERDEVLHGRINKRDQEWRDFILEDRKWKEQHQRESSELHRDVTEMGTKVQMHIGNGHRHQE